MNKPILGNLYLVDDINVAMASKNMPGTFTISLTEEAGYIKYIPEAMGGTILLPPYEAMIYLSDGDFNNFRDIYLQYLSLSPEIDLFLSVILRACLINDSRLIFYVPKEELSLGFFSVIAEYIANCFGIVIGTVQNAFYYNPVYDPIVMERIYVNELMNKEELMTYFPPKLQFTQPTVTKLVADMNLKIGKPNASIFDYAEWLYNYKERIKQAGDVYLERGLIKL